MLHFVKFGFLKVHLTLQKENDMKSIFIQRGSDVLKGATITDTVRNGSLTVHAGISEAGSEFITVDERSSKIIIITTLSSGSSVLIDAI